MTTVSAATKESRTMKPINSIDRIIHDIHNDLQVIRMETELTLTDPHTNKETEIILGAVESIDSLLTELRQHWPIEEDTK